MAELEFESPHKQIKEDFHAIVTKVHDGDTITVKVDFRDFEFPVRFLNTNAPELGEEGAEESQEWLEGLILGEPVDIIIDPKQRVGKYGRILGVIMLYGIDVNDHMVQLGYATTFDNRDEGKLPNINKELILKLE